MRYCGTENIEVIKFNPMDALDETHFIQMNKVCDDSIFCVSCCCDDEWQYSFHMEDNTIYERVKYNIMEAIFKCETVNDLLDYLGWVFEEGFDDVIVYDDEYDDDDDDDDGSGYYGCCMGDCILH